jgi:hypothetical protein
VIGDVVNVASRIESLNKELRSRVLVSDETWTVSALTRGRVGTSTGTAMPRLLERTMTAAVLATVVLACSGGSTTGASGGDGGSSGAVATCDPAKTGACGKGAACVAHSYGNVAACEEAGGDGMAWSDLGCQACVTAADCTLSSGGGCIDGSCREKIGYPWVKNTTVKADDALLGARCCGTGHVMCAIGSDGRNGCKCI